MPVIYKTSELSKDDYKNIANKLKKNEIMIYPTETIYGIGGNALINSVYKKIMSIKKRKEDKNFIWLFKDVDMIKNYVSLNKIEEKIINKYLPGALTIILKSKISDYETIGVRISPHPFLKNLFEYINFPLISTSANISNNKYIHDFNRIVDIFKDKVNFFIKDDDKKDKKNAYLPSTIIKVTNNKVKIIREGQIKLTNLS
jgi:L-threonylcarbamoyladenylate synthase